MVSHFPVWKCPKCDDFVIRKGDPRGSYIENQETGEVMYLEAKNGVYVLNTKVAPRRLQTHPFGGPGR